MSCEMQRQLNLRPVVAGVWGAQRKELGVFLSVQVPPRNLSLETQMYFGNDVR